MQRSRRTLQQRRVALERNAIHKKKHFYEVSASLVIAIWILIFLNSMIDKGNSYGDIQGSPLSEISLHDAPSYPDDSLQLSDTSFTNQHKVSILEGEFIANNAEGLVNERSIMEESTIQKDHTTEIVTDSGINIEKEAVSRNDRLSRITPPGLDEFKNKAIALKEKTISRQQGTLIHRVDPSGKEYNYASASKGAKVLAYNKEAKGASNILDKDKDKYLRNPCSAEEKYVVIELSEETLVDSIEIANFEHYSSNLKDFELLICSVYPTDCWVNIGNFTAPNAKHAQRFYLPEPKWTRYLKINFLSHYGSEFFCTLSLVEVYGVDAVERMLEDMISVESNRVEPDEQIAEQLPDQGNGDGEDTPEEFFSYNDDHSSHENLKPKREHSKDTSLHPTLETKPAQLARMPGDTVLKILMQKVQTLDWNFSLLERYLEELNSRYGRIFKGIDDDITNKDLLLEKIQLEINNFQKNDDVIASDIRDLLIWKTDLSSQLDQLVKESAVLRSEIEVVQEHQIDMENNGLAVIFVSFVFGCLAVSKLLLNLILKICMIDKSGKFCQRSSCWIVLLLSSIIVAYILTI